MNTRFFSFSSFAGKFFIPFLCLMTFFKINFFQKILWVSKTVWIQTILSVLIWVQTVCKGYQCTPRQKLPIARKELQLTRCICETLCPKYKCNSQMLKLLKGKYTETKNNMSLYTPIFDWVSIKKSCVHWLWYIQRYTVNLLTAKHFISAASWVIL